MPVRPTLLHRMALVSFLLFRKNLGNLREFFGQMVYRPPWQKIARTPMIISEVYNILSSYYTCRIIRYSLKTSISELFTISTHCHVL